MIAITWAAHRQNATVLLQSSFVILILLFYFCNFADVVRVVIWPPDILVGGLRFYRDFSMSELWSITLPYKSRAAPPQKKTTFYRRLRNLTANLTACNFGTKHDIHNRTSALETRRGLLYRLRTTRTLVRKQLQTGPSFLSTLYVNSAF